MVVFSFIRTNPKKEWQPPRERQQGRPVRTTNNVWNFLKEEEGAEEEVFF